jgi:hypothetical protein
MTTKSQLSRRGALLSMCAAGLVGSSATLGKGSAAGAATGEVLSAAQRYMRARSNAANPGSPGLPTSALMSRSVSKFEADRAKYMRSLGSRFDYDGQILSLSSDISNVTISQADTGGFQVSLYERMGLNWVPNPRPVPDSPGDELVRSAIGTPHIIQLEQGSKGWSVVSHAYSERDLYGTSPDVDKTLSQELNSTTADTSSSLAGTDVQIQADPPYNIYDRLAARNYAINYAINYNGNYVHYNCSGGDCANFVSQSFWAGGQLPADAWQRVITSSCGISNKYGGNALQWYNNQNLRAWVTNHARGATVGAIGSVNNGDIVNYDWAGGGTDHVAMMTKQSSLLVSCHNSDRLNVPWQLGGAQSYIFTTMFDHY